MRALLVPVDGGESIELVKDLTLVGRKEDCDLRLEHKSVSKLHCVILKTEGMLVLRDLGSTNSTRVNGQRIRRASLFPNDQLTIASYKFQVQFTQEEAPAEPDDHTQQLDAKEVVKLLNRLKGGEAPVDSQEESDDEDDGEVPQGIQHNPLPDVYPEENRHKKKGK